MVFPIFIIMTMMLMVLILILALVTWLILAGTTPVPVLASLAPPVWNLAFFVAGEAEGFLLREFVENF